MKQLSEGKKSIKPYKNLEREYLKTMKPQTSHCLSISFSQSPRKPSSLIPFLIGERKLGNLPHPVSTLWPLPLSSLLLHTISNGIVLSHHLNRPKHRFEATS